MKTRILAASLVAAGFSFNAMADTATLTVNANVTGVCKFQAATATLNILQSGGAIDPSVNTAATGSTTIDYKCTKGVSPTFTANTGANPSGGNNRVTNGTDFMVYTLTLTPPAASGQGFAAGAQQLAIGGDIAVAAFQAASAGAYTDSVTLTVTP